MREKRLVCGGILTVLVFMLLSWAYLRVEAAAFLSGGDQEAVVLIYDRTALPQFVYNPDSIAALPLLGESGMASGLPEALTPLQAAEGADEIFFGRAENLSCTAIGGVPWTLTDVRVIEPAEGSLEAGLLITVCWPGGYISAEDLGQEGEGYYTFKPEGLSRPDKGGTGWFLIAPAPEEMGLPDGAYIPATENMGFLPGGKNHMSF